MNLELDLEKEKLKVPPNMHRSPEWPRIRSEFLSLHPICSICESSKKVEVHHIRPFHLHPELELDPTNFISLCESNENGHDCHLGFGHLGNFKSFNTSIREDSKTWNEKIKTRPYEEGE